MSVESQNLSPAQRRTLPGRTALQAKFSSEEERRAFYSEIGKKSHAHVRLSRDDAEAIAAAYRLLAQIASKIGVDPASGEGGAA